MFKCEFATGNAAFADDMECEISRILSQIAGQIGAMTDAEGGDLFDINGNKIGAWSLTEN